MGKNYGEGYKYEFIQIPAGKKVNGEEKPGWIEFTITCKVTASRADWNNLDHDSEAFQQIYINSTLKDKEWDDVGAFYNYSYTEASKGNPAIECKSMPITSSSIWCTYVPYVKNTKPGISDAEEYTVKKPDGTVEKKKDHLAYNITSVAGNKNGQINGDQGEIQRQDGKKDLGYATTSRDVYILKQYNVGINTFIKEVYRADGVTKAGENEYLVDNKANYWGNDENNVANRRDKSEKARKENPVYVENGDVVVIRMILKTDADKNVPYYWKPKTLQKVAIPFDLDIDDNFEVISTEVVKGTSQNNIEKKKKRIIVSEVSNDTTIIIDIKLKINNKQDTAVGWRSNAKGGARSISSNIGYEKNEENLPNGVYVTNYFGSKDCFNTAWWDDYDKIKRYRGGAFNPAKWEQEYNNYVGNELLATKTADYFQVKSYNVALDQYIEKVEHQQIRGTISKIDKKETYNCELRRSFALQNRGQDISAAQAQVEKARAEVVAVQNQLTAVQNEVATAQNQIVTAQSQIVNLQNQAQFSKNELERAQEELRLKQLLVEEAEKRLQKAEEELEKAKESGALIEIFYAQQQKDDAKRQVSEAQGIVEMQQERVNRWQREFESYQVRIIAFQNEIVTAQNKIVAGQAKILELYTKLEEAQVKLLEAQDKVEDMYISTGWNKESDGSKVNNPVSVEYGDIVTYKIQIYNTNEASLNTISHYGIEDGKKRKDKPYKKPKNIKVDIDNVFSSPNYTVLGVYNSNGAAIANTKHDKTLSLTGVNVAAGSVETITIQICVEDQTRNIVVSNATRLVKVVNVNDFVIDNKSKENVRKANDYYKLNDYTVNLNQYISTYNAEMAIYNDDHRFTTGEARGLTKQLGEQYTEREPLFTEKYETLSTTTIVKNEASDGENEFGTNDVSGITRELISPAKYNTRARPTEVIIFVPQGLNIIGRTIKWYNANDTEKYSLELGRDYKYDEDTGKYTIINENVILAPGEYLSYVLELKVMESNFYLGNLQITSTLNKLTNINRSDPDQNGNRIEREVTGQNTSNNIRDFDVLKLKELVIAGTVWSDDSNRNGEREDNEPVRDDVTVKLYRERTTEPDEEVVYVLKNEKGVSQYVVVDEKQPINGLYTFGRQPRAHGNTYYKYFIEFEYDGVKYKATEVYGGDSDGDADGMHNLGGKVGSNTWRQGYEDLPDARTGNVNYMKDSNAYEFDDVRNSFNEGYQTIFFNKAYNSKKDLEYNKDDHISTLEDDKKRVMKARSFIKQKYDIEEGVVENRGENTHELFLQNYTQYSTTYPETEYLKFINLGLVKREEVDLSLDADVYSVKTTINGEEMTYDYNKNDADSTKDNYSNTPNAYKLGNELRGKYQLDFYTSDYYYRIDSYYTSGDDKENNTEGDKIAEYKQTNQFDGSNIEKNLTNKNSSELDAQVTYRVRIANKDIKQDEPNVTATGISKDKDIPIRTQINELTIYYSKNFIKADNEKEVAVKEKDKNGILEDSSHKVSSVKLLDSKGTELETKLEINQTSAYENARNDYDERNYNVMYLTGMEDIWLAEGENIYVEITLTIDKDDNRCLKITEDEDMGLEMIAEISAYTTKYDDSYYHKAFANKVAGLVDRDSNPGNLGVNAIPAGDCEDYKQYEDDTYKVGIKIGLLNDPDDPNNPDNPIENKTEERKITGMVWEDTRSNEIGDNDSKQYLGNGEYDNTDKKNNNASTPPNGITQDNPVQDVKVSLIEVIQTKATNSDGGPIYYEYPARYTYTIKNEFGEIICKKGEKIETRTNDKGEYTLAHFIPGYYKVRFDYGDDEKRTECLVYNGQDYKSTTYYNNNYLEDSTISSRSKSVKAKALLSSTGNPADRDPARSITSSSGTSSGTGSINWSDNIGSKSNSTYFDEVKKALKYGNDGTEGIEKEGENGETIKEGEKIIHSSDAQDDEIRRLNVNAYAETMTALQAVVFSENSKTCQTEIDENEEGYEELQERKQINDKRLTQNTHMYAESTIFYVKPEEVDSGEMNIDPSEMENFNQTRLWNITNLDFGLEYRPEASILLDKEIASIKITTSNQSFGQTKALLEMYFENDGNGNRIIDKNHPNTKGIENVQFVPNQDKKQQGQVYINMDTDILQGATVQIEYEMETTNASEVDRINKNLYNIRYDALAYEEGYGDKRIYTTHNAQIAEDPQNIEYTYNANATAAQVLAGEYYDGSYTYEEGKENYKYLKKLKKSYKLNGITEIQTETTKETSMIKLKGQDYYGMYLGETYYTGKIGNNDVITELKIDHILDYVDNDLVFDEAKNNTQNKVWGSVTSQDLRDRNLLNWDKMNKEIEDGGYEEGYQEQRKIYYLTDKFGIRYDTKNRSNLILSANDNKLGKYGDGGENGEGRNASLSRFLKTKAKGSISLITSKLLSADDIDSNTGLSYENIAEVVQYTTLTGRRTKLPSKNGGGVIGNGNIKDWYRNDITSNEPTDPKPAPEDDTDAPEIVTITPRPGL